MPGKHHLRGFKIAKKSARRYAARGRCSASSLGQTPPLGKKLNPPLTSCNLNKLTNVSSMAIAHSMLKDTVFLHRENIKQILLYVFSSYFFTDNFPKKIHPKCAPDRSISISKMQKLLRLHPPPRPSPRPRLRFPYNIANLTPH